MAKAFGIVSFAGNHVRVDGLRAYRPAGAFSFLGRYRIIDFPISNMSNSGIDQIQVYIRRQPRSLAEHLGSGRHYNINSKRGKLQLLFTENSLGQDFYNTDIAAYAQNMESIEAAHQPYVIIAPSYMIYTQDYNALLNAHIESGADITLLYHTVDNAKDYFLKCNCVNLNKQKGVLGLEVNQGNAKNKHISMDTYIMKTELFMEIVKRSVEVSSMYTLADMINLSCEALDIRGISHKGFFAAANDFKSYYDANISLIDLKTASGLFHEDWSIYTRTNDSCPTQYFDSASVKSSVVSNGCLIKGQLENSVLGRGCEIKEGAVVKNCVILADVVIGKDVHVENMVIDKGAKITRMKEIVADPATPGYIKRRDLI